MRVKISWAIVMGWIGATIVAAITLTSGAYAVFETKEHALSTRDLILRELHHIREDVKEMKEWLKESR